MSRVRILLSARDPGAAGNVAALARAFSEDGRFDVKIVASGEALDMLRHDGQSPRPFAFNGGRDSIQDGDSPAPLLEAAGQLLADIRPDAVLSSQSSFGVGIDEALLVRASVSTFAMQDFWGGVNLGLGTPADLYLVMDEFAAGLTRERWGVQAVAVGSPKYARYGNLDVPGMREESRRRLGVGEGDRVLGFFGQSPAIPGLESAFHDLVSAMSGLRPPPLLLLREHPKSQGVRQQHAALAQERGLAVADVTGTSFAEAWLVACDVVTTTLSLCGLDHAHLSACSPQPLGSVLYLMTNEEIRAYAQQSWGLSHLPTVNRGLGRVVTEPAGLAEQLERAFGSDERKAYFEASGRLSNPDPCGIIASTVLTAVLEGARASSGTRKG